MSCSSFGLPTNRLSELFARQILRRHQDIAAIGIYESLNTLPDFWWQRRCVILVKFYWLYKIAEIVRGFEWYTAYGAWLMESVDWIESIFQSVGSNLQCASLISKFGAHKTFNDEKPIRREREELITRPVFARLYNWAIYSEMIYSELIITLTPSPRI